MEIVFEDIFISEGYNRSLLVDLTRAKYFLIPNDWGEYIKKNNRSNCFSKLLKTAPELYYFLKENEFICDIDEKLFENFPKLSFNFERPNLGEVLFMQISEINYESVLLLFDLEGISDIGVMRIYLESNFPLEKIEFLLDKIYYLQPAVSIIVHTEIPISFNEKYSSLIQNTFKNNRNYSFFEILENELSFPVFISSIDQLSESCSYNVFVNGVIFIDKFGSMSFGSKEIKYHIDDRIIGDKLKCIQEENSSWNIPLSKVEICKDCEFNRICIDSRIPYAQGNSYGKADCSYNPYLSLWSSDANYRRSSDCGDINEEGEFVVNTHLVENILSICNS